MMLGTEGVLVGDKPQHWPAVVAGVVALLAGGVSVFRSASDAGTTALLVVGALLLVGPFIIPRIEKISVSADAFELALTKQIAEQGAPATAQLLNHSDLARLTEAYGVIRAEFPGDGDKMVRSKVEDALVRRAAEFAKQHKFDRDEVSRLFGRAAPVTRVLLLGLLDGDPALVDAATLASAIARPATQNEQYHGLRLAEKYWSRLDQAERATIRSLTSAADFGGGQTDRRVVADRLLTK